jgi:small subunit ribosomal protein S13
MAGKKPRDKGIKAEEATEVKPVREEEHEELIRIASYDIPGSRNLYSGLTRIKGISWTISNVLCKKLGFERSKKISSLTDKEIEKIEDYLKNLDAPDFIKNRRFDPENGETGHLIGIDLDLKKDFDIKRLKKIKSYKGVRHTSKLPVRGQRTRGHFRKVGIAVGVKKAKVGKKG